VELPERATDLTVSVVTSVLVPRDAISTACRQQLGALARFGRRHGLRLRLRVYARACEVADSRVRVVPDLGAVAVDDHFLESDLILYHFGVVNPLFDSIHLAPPAAKVVVCYYGITPPDLVPEPQRSVLYESYRQAVNVLAADQVLVTSRFLRDELADRGVRPGRIVQVPLPAPFAYAPAGAGRAAGDELRLAYVGRFVPAKGVHDLLRAVRLLRERTGVAIRLELLGSRTFSDPGYLDSLQAFITEHGLTDRVRFAFDVSAEELRERLRQAHVLVNPSYHEGFSVPVIEGLACGCFVVCADAGALPETSGGLGRCFPAGDVGQLCGRLEELLEAAGDTVRTDSGTWTRAEWQGRVARHLAGYTPAAWEAQFCTAILGDLDPARGEGQRHLARVRRRTLLSLSELKPHAGEGPAVPARVRTVLAAAGIRPGSPPPADAPAAQPTAAAGGTEPERHAPAPPASKGTRLRARLRSVPYVGKCFQYVRRLILLPWNFTKFYEAFFQHLRESQALDRRLLVQIAEELRVLSERSRGDRAALERLLAEDWPALAAGVRANQSDLRRLLEEVVPEMLDEVRRASGRGRPTLPLPPGRAVAG
jgi:glycosyltransferase involved in cell wall biosynthesis